MVELLAGVADALSTAHDAGILHRDIKPDNILVTKNGYAKLADFGLAKLAGSTEGDTRTVSATPTRHGVILGTIDYLSPEQARGAPLDARSHIFSFGDDALKVLARIDPALDPLSVSLIHFALGDSNRGFEYLTKSVERRQGPVRWLNVWPFFDNVRSDPRLVSLVARLNLPDPPPSR